MAFILFLQLQIEFGIEKRENAVYFLKRRLKAKRFEKVSLLVAKECKLGPRKKLMNKNIRLANFFI